MLERTHPDAVLREAVLEELQRRSKLKDVVLRALGLRERSVDQEGECPLWIVSLDKERQHPWHEAMLTPGGDCPIGFVVNTYDHGWIVLVHEVFYELTEEQQALIRRYAALTLGGRSHAKILATLNQDTSQHGHALAVLRDARRRVQILDPSVLFSPDGGLRVELGSLSQTTKNLLREGITGEYLFILPKYLFESRTNYADVEFLVYLNFFVRYGTRTRIVGTARQREVLEQLLRLTIFGLFDPHAREQPSFETLRSRYNVPDRETYALFRMLYDKYGVRQNCCATGAILGLDAYIDFVVLDNTARPLLIASSQQEAAPHQAAPGLYSVQIAPLPHGSFEVSIVQTNGQIATKTLEVRRPTRRQKSIPEDLCHAIRFATDRPRFGVTPLGTSHGFDPVGDLTCFVIWVNGLGILVDPSPEGLEYLEQIGVAATDLPYVFLTHIHSDHDGGLISKLLSGRRTTIIASDVVFRLFVEKARLVTGQDFQQARLVEHIAVNPGPPVVLDVAGERVILQTRWNLHTIPTNGFTITIDNKTFGYAGDTQYEPSMLRQLLEAQQLTPAQYHDLMYFLWTEDGTPKVDLLYHEAGIPPIHTDKHTLTTLSEAMRSRTFLVHVADWDVPPGFVPSKPPLFATHVLFPATARSRNRTLIHTLGLVSYLYDAPVEILEALLHRCTLRVFEPEEVIIRAGQVQYTEPLAFYVVTDGQVDVIEHGRVVSRLLKGDSFGEWGISHQRGFRIADVIARRPTQVMEFDEETYRWLVDQHPSIQPRIGKIRDLLPKLQAVRTRACQKSAHDPTRTRSVIEEMNSGQLSAFAVFSEVKRYQRWDAVVVEGEEADGLYILLSGHLHVAAGGKPIGELMEADVFGELGLLEARERMATIRVASADAEILFMSRQNFTTLLQKVPAFSFGIRTVAAQRQELSKARARRSKGPRRAILHAEEE
jgi:CRP-like cAMP-binding protein